MKRTIGITALLLFLAFTGILVLRIWNIHIISLDTLVRSGATLIVLSILLITLIVIYGAFFRNRQSSYRRDAGKQAQPKA